MVYLPLQLSPILSFTAKHKSSKSNFFPIWTQKDMKNLFPSYWDNHKQSWNRTNTGCGRMQISSANCLLRSRVIAFLWFLMAPILISTDCWKYLCSIVGSIKSWLMLAFGSIAEKSTSCAFRELIISWDLMLLV